MRRSRTAPPWHCWRWGWWPAAVPVPGSRTRGVRPIGSRALNIARIEAGFLLPNLDFISAAHTLRVGSERSPLELGLGWLVDFGKGHFTGRRALLEEQRRGPRRLLIGLDIEGNKPAHNALLYADRAGRKQAGSVTSAAWSPTTKRNLALAMVDAPHFATGATLWAGTYLNRELQWQRRMARARVLIDGVGKTFGACTAVDNVNLGIYKGEMFALVGAS